MRTGGPTNVRMSPRGALRCSSSLLILYLSCRVTCPQYAHEGRHTSHHRTMRHHTQSPPPVKPRRRS
ncbi:hypothetical protein PF008_g21382 [Phytophthora fragariae]|uniref:Uncharacterized protein n=1 Tax=Phytophthora fragariae TaxID=53985 RepID=A0A6G0QWS0_9STRA|nr:hypothetical protein PF008_g21382 [Phytophthora fragariae]